jgi:DNA-binding transcriptional LysR family regulator
LRIFFHCAPLPVQFFHHRRLLLQPLVPNQNSIPDFVRLPSIAHIRAFETAVRLGSFERASEQLSITPSAVSKRVATLETLLGVKLLNRIGRGVELTTAGKEYLEQVGVALSMLARSSFHQRTSASQKRLRITLPPTFTRQILIPHLTEFTSAHPDIELELLLSIPFLDITAPGCDLEIHFGEGIPEALDGELAVDEPVFPVCTPMYLAQIGGMQRPADLAKATLLRSPLEPWQPWFDAAGLSMHEPASGHRLVDLGMLLEAATNHQGMALARRSLALNLLQHGTLVQPFRLTAKPKFSYYICWQRKQGIDDVERKFVDWLKSVCASAAAAE